MAEGAPVDLGLLAGIDLEAQIGFARARGADHGDVAPQLADAEREAALLQVLEQPGAGEVGQVGEPLDDVGLERLERAGSLGPLAGVVLQGAADNGVVDGEAASDRLDAPALDQDQARICARISAVIIAAPLR